MPGSTRRHPPGVAWSTGNAVRPLVHGAPYFAELHDRIEATGPGDLVLFADWRADPDERLTDDPDHTLSATLTAAARRGVAVRGLLWRSHDRALGFHAERSRQLGLDLERAGGECLRDMRVAPGGSHHQKFVVIRHADDPSRDIAYVGGIDLCHSRRDTAEHDGDPQPIAMPQVFGPDPGLARRALRGPGARGPRHRDDLPGTVGGLDAPDAATPAASPRASSSARTSTPGRCPTNSPRPRRPPTRTRRCRSCAPTRRSWPRASTSHRTASRASRAANDKAVRGARRLVYLEDQYLWSEEVGRHFGEALRANPELRLVAVIPIAPDVDGAVSLPPQLYGRMLAMDLLLEAGGDRVALYGLTSPRGYPVYVHSKVCIIDDRWASVGSDNFNRRSWTNDSELSVAVQDDRAADAGDDVPRDAFALRLRRELVAEHVGIDPDEVPDDPDLAVGPHGRGRRRARRLVRRRGARPGAGCTCRGRRLRCAARPCGGGAGHALPAARRERNVLPGGSGGSAHPSSPGSNVSGRHASTTSSTRTARWASRTASTTSAEHGCRAAVLNRCWSGQVVGC